MSYEIVNTIKDKCKRCYSCIRECPAKAIKVINGQAAVIPERCISCGHCVKVCSQNAKQILSDVDLVFSILSAKNKTAAIVAPSFVASFPDNYNKLPSALKELGFNLVIETAFGADLISPLYLSEYKNENNQTLISSSCPAVVNYIEMYHTELIPNIAKIVSPMIALGRYIKSLVDPEMKVVFIGPCVAKKSEYKNTEVDDAVDAVLTFSELKEIFVDRNILFEELDEIDFDPPHAFMGKSYPLAGGLLKTAEISGDILEKEIIVVEGKKKVLELIEEISNKHINSKFVDILFCEGCISGPAIDSDLNYYARREKIIGYVESKINQVDKQIWKSNLYNSRELNLKRQFTNRNQRRPFPSENRIKEILARTNKFSLKDELNCGACGYGTCREYAVAIAKDLAEKDMCLPFLIDKLDSAYNEIKNTQEQLQSAEKLASIGQLAAGVAHEINNPLGTILLYSSMLKNDLAEKVKNPQYSEDLNLIVEEANRCKNIVSNLLDFARQGKLNVTEFDINHLIKRTIKSVLAKFCDSITIEFNSIENHNIIEADYDQLKQVILNLLNNACEAMEDNHEKKIVVNIYNTKNGYELTIKDSGCGISKENFGKIFSPFFTTKKIGKGTGLGLAISYGIIKMHRGSITFESNENQGTIFKLKLPQKVSMQRINLN